MTGQMKEEEEEKGDELETVAPSWGLRQSTPMASDATLLILNVWEFTDTHLTNTEVAVAVGKQVDASRDTSRQPALGSRRRSTYDDAHFYSLTYLIIDARKQVRERWNHGRRRCWRWWSFHIQSSKLYVSQFKLFYTSITTRRNLELLQSVAHKVGTLKRV